MFEAVAYHDGACRSAAFFERKGGGVAMPRIYTLLAALAAIGSHPRPGLVLLAFCGAQVLAQIPVTPGGLGFVEAGLTAMLALAGVSAGDAVLATFAYRLFSYWLPLPFGLVGLAIAPGGEPVAATRAP
jgi:uncharacterized protein (TIRG00374 family)